MLRLTQPKPEVLIVEDNPQINRLFCKQFRATGLHVQGTASVTETINQLKAGIIPVVMILDLELGDGHGTQVLDYLEQHGLYDVQVIIVSAHTFSNLYDLSSYPIVDALIKPVSPRGLSVLVHKLLNVSETRQA